MNTSTFAHQHAELETQAQAILSAVSQGTEEAMRDLPAKRLAFSRMINNHCGVEIKLVNARSRLSGDDARATALIRRFHDELLTWRADLMDCNANWSQRRVVDDPNGFLAVFRGLTSRLAARVQWEEQEFYPTVLSATGRR